jgi:hypothetical protein
MNYAILGVRVNVCIILGVANPCITLGGHVNLCLILGGRVNVYILLLGVTVSQNLISPDVALEAERGDKEEIRIKK